jgi:hypothetical protein
MRMAYSLFVRPRWDGATRLRLHTQRVNGGRPAGQPVRRRASKAVWFHLLRMSALSGGFKGSMQHPLRASNENANSMLDLYLFKGRNSPVTFSRTNQDSMAVVPNRWKTQAFKALAICKGRCCVDRLNPPP